MMGDHGFLIGCHNPHLDPAIQSADAGCRRTTAKIARWVISEPVLAPPPAAKMQKANHLPVK
jgi:hypothetical protein